MAALDALGPRIGLGTQATRPRAVAARGLGRRHGLGCPRRRCACRRCLAGPPLARPAPSPPGVLAGAAASGPRACAVGAPLPKSMVRSRLRLSLASCTTKKSQKSHRTTWTRTHRSSARKVLSSRRSIRAAPSSGLRYRASCGRCMQGQSPRPTPTPRRHGTRASVHGGLYPMGIDYASFHGP